MLGAGGPDYDARYGVYRGARRRLVKAIRYCIACVCIRCIYGIGERIACVYRMVGNGYDDGCGIDNYGKRLGVCCLAVACAYSKVVGAHMGGVGGPAYDTGCSVYRGARRRLVKAVCYYIVCVCIRCTYGIGERTAHIYRIVCNPVYDWYGRIVVDEADGDRRFIVVITAACSPV